MPLSQRSTRTRDTDGSHLFLRLRGWRVMGTTLVVLSLAMVVETAATGLMHHPVTRFRACEEKWSRDAEQAPPTASDEAQQSPLYVCDPHHQLVQREELQTLLRDFQATWVTATCADGSQRTVHPQMGVAVMATESENEMAEAAIELHRRWGLGNVTTGPFACHNVGVTLVLVEGNTHVASSEVSSDMIGVDVSVGEALQGPLGDAVEHLQQRLEHCWIYTQCIDRVLTDPYTGIPHLTRLLETQTHQPDVEVDAIDWVDRVETTIGFVLFMCTRLCFLVLLYYCLLAASRDTPTRRRRRRDNRGQDTAVTATTGSKHTTRYDDYGGGLRRETVTPGQFQGDSCPICLDPFHQVRLVNHVPNRRPPEAETAPLLGDSPFVYSYVMLVGAEDRAAVRTFDCGHCLCETCWKGLVKVHEGTFAEEDNVVPCPICRKTVVVAKDHTHWTALDQLRTPAARWARVSTNGASSQRPVSLPRPHGPSSSSRSRTRRVWERTPMAAPALAPRAWPRSLSHLWVTSSSSSSSSNSHEAEEESDLESCSSTYDGWWDNHDDTGMLLDGHRGAFP